MARAKSTKLTADERKDLESIGWSEATPFNIPENIDPTLKARIIEQYSEQEGVENPATDLPDATYRQNEIVRQRVAAEEADPLDHDHDGKRGGHVDNRRQGEVNK